MKFSPTTRLAGYLVMFTLFTGLAGCAQPPVPKESFYRFSVSTPTQAATATPKFDGVVEIGRFTADGVISERSLAYADLGKGDAGTLARYSYHYWVEPPPQAMQKVLAEYVRASGLFRQAVTPDLRLPANYELQGKMRRFEQLLSGNKATVVVELELSITDIHEGKLIHLDTYSVEQEAANASPAAAVAALETATAEAFTAFIADLAD